jgi:transposase
MEKQAVALSKYDKEYLNKYVSKGKHSARAIKRAHVLLLLNDGVSASEVSDRAGVSLATVYNLKNRYQEQKGEASKVIEDKPRPGQPPKITPEVEAQITALACSKAPEGRSEWTLRLLADKVVELGYVDELSHEAVRKCLKKASSSLGKGSSGA